MFHIWHADSPSLTQWTLSVHRRVVRFGCCAYSPSFLGIQDIAIYDSYDEYILVARLHIVYVGQTSNGRWRLSSLSVVITLAYATQHTRGQLATAGQ